MLVERMNDKEFALEVIRDYFDEMRNYADRALTKKGKIKKRHASSYSSKRGNKWLIIYRPEHGGVASLSVKRPQLKDWFTWYSLIPTPDSITLFGFNKHVAQRISERYHPELTPSEALKEMLMRTPAVIQSEAEDTMYTRVNGGICLGSVYGKRISINVGLPVDLQVEIRETSTFISDDLLYDDQNAITEESIARAIAKLGKDYLPDHDREIR